MAKAETKVSETKPESRKPGKGDDVLLVLASGEKAPATIDSVRKDGTVDLSAVIGKSEVTITSSPRDDEGKKPDSWSFAPTAAEIKAAEQAAEAAAVAAALTKGEAAKS